MAEMYPASVETTPNMDSGSLGEARVFEIIKESLPDDWVVIHDCWRYFINGKNRYTNYEMDFIVLVPMKGFVVIEVKNWFRAEVENGIWKYWGMNGQIKTMGNKMSPLNQAFIAAKNLNKELLDVKKFELWYKDPVSKKGRIAFHSLAVLLRQTPDIVDMAKSVKADVEVASENGLPLEQLYICGEDNLQKNLKEKIESLFAIKSPDRIRPLEPYYIKQIISYLLPSFHFMGDPVAYNRIMEDAAASIHSVLPMLEGTELGISVTGCAGSGKTWMATQEMARLYRKYGALKRILFLCFNKALAEHVRRIPNLAEGVRNGGIEVYTFPAFCKRVEGKKYHDESRDWFNKLQNGDLSTISSICRNITEAHQYDFIFIDECQDFHVTWGFIVSAMQHKGTKMYYFSDSNQNIFRENGAFSYLVETPTRLKMNRNIRNTKEIALYSSAMLDKQERMEHIPVPGMEVVVLNNTPDVRERARLVNEWIKRLIRGKKADEDMKKAEIMRNNWLVARPNQIVVLSPYSPNKDEIAGKEVNPACSLPYNTCISSQRDIVELLELRDKNEKMIIGTSIRSFKGLEADYVILTDVDEPGVDRAQTANDFYVACTRAKYGLIIIPKSEEGEAYARRISVMAKEQ